MIRKFRNCFEQAVKWELMEKNPCTHATVPKHKSQKRDIWTADTLMYALSVCEDERLKLAINLSFSCSLRLGELLGLTWDCVDISPDSVRKIFLPKSVANMLVDWKAEQGDSGHAQVNMVTDVYSHILDDDRRKNAELFEEAFYEKKNLDPQMHVQQENNNATVADEVDPELLAKVLANPEMRALLNSLAKTMK